MYRRNVYASAIHTNTRHIYICQKIKSEGWRSCLRPRSHFWRRRGGVRQAGFHILPMLPLARPGCQLVLAGDSECQLLSIGDTGPEGQDLTRDISESVMLKSAVGCKRLRLTESHRSDPTLFAWYSSMAPGLKNCSHRRAKTSHRRGGRSTTCACLTPPDGA